MQAEKEYPGPTLVQRGNYTSRTDEYKHVTPSYIVEIVSNLEDSECSMGMSRIGMFAGQSTYLLFSISIHL